MNSLPRKTISSVPELANRTPFAFVIDSLLMRAANYAIGHYDRSHLMLLDKFKNLAGDVGVGANVATIHFPVAQLFRRCILGWHNANSDLCRSAQVWTVEGNRCYGPSPQSLAGFLAQALEKPIFQHVAILRELGRFLHGSARLLMQRSLRRWRRRDPLPTRACARQDDGVHLMLRNSRHLTYLAESGLNVLAGRGFGLIIRHVEHRIH